MLLWTKTNKALLVPGDIDAAGASAMLASGAAVEVGSIKLARDARFAGPEYSGSFDAGETVRVPEDMPEQVAQRLLSVYNSFDVHHAANPHQVIAAERKPEAVSTSEAV